MELFSADHESSKLPFMSAVLEDGEEPVQELKTACVEAVETNMSSVITAFMNTYSKKTSDLDVLSKKAPLATIESEVNASSIVSKRAQVLFKKCAEPVTSEFFSTRSAVVEMQDTTKLFESRKFIQEFMSKKPEHLAEVKKNGETLASLDRIAFTVAAMIELWRTVKTELKETRGSICTRALKEMPQSQVPDVLWKLLKQASEGRPPFQTH